MRLDWIDKAKGIGIILVILGHTFCPPSIQFWLYSFHMPLFFFLSGYVFKIKTSNFSDFFKNKVNSLLIPAFFMEFIVIFYSLIEAVIFKTNYSINFLERFLGIFIQRRGGHFSFGPWFLICLFVVQILMFFLVKYIENDMKLFISGIIFSALGYIYCTLIGIVLPWSIEVASSASFFFIIGYLAKQKCNLFEGLIKKTIFYIVFFYQFNYCIFPIQYYWKA